MAARPRHISGGVDAFHTRKHNATAHIPGMGPEGKKCNDCANLHTSSHRYPGGVAKHTRCSLWGGMMTPKVSLDKTPTISPTTEACKYFEQFVPKKRGQR